MRWIIDFNDIIQATYWLAAAVSVLSLLLVMQVMWMRRSARARENRQKTFRTVWGTILHLPGRYTGPLPPVSHSELPTFMMMWNQAQASTYRMQDAGSANAARNYLNGIAQRLGMSDVAMRLLRDREVATRLLAIEMLGYLGDVTASPLLHSMVDSPSAVLSFAAARALLQLNPAFADRFVALMTRRTDWSAARLQAVVQEDRAKLASPITDLVRTSPAAVSRNVVQYLRFFDRARALPVVRHLLESVTDPDALTASLKVLGEIGTSEDGPVAADLAGHEDWRVRVQVANALGRLGDQRQIPAVTALLDDSHWWVRFRAAQALSSLSKDDDARLRGILERTKDRYARDILTQIIAERQPALQKGTSS